MRKHLSYANVAATLALVIAVAGGSVAVAGSVKKAPKNSVRTKSIVDGSITAKKLRELVSVSKTSSFQGPGVGSVTAPCPVGSIALGGSVGSDGVLNGTGSTGPNNAWQGGASSTVAGPHTISATVWCLPAK
jgi:hypothetical protein